MSGLFDKTTNALGAAAQFRQLRQNITGANIANAETPGYVAKKVDFEESLARAIDLDGTGTLETSQPEHFPTGRGSLSSLRADVYDNPDVNKNVDGNTVDLEREMATLAENSIMYKAAVQLINKKIAALKYAASEGGR
ncbi:MAG: flagellar basal body rod protein FlgB [Bdellovibrionaceae bacterium]|nr:flagellar basal body rod protein FlgB [Pseudobdellovibrionaceae bacterium]